MPPDSEGGFDVDYTPTILDRHSLDRATERAAAAAAAIIAQMLPDLRLGAVLHSLLDAATAGTAGLSQSRDEARYILLASALAAGRFEPDAIRLSAAILLLEIGLRVLEYDDAGRSWTFPLAYSPKILSAAACALLGALPAALVQSASDRPPPLGSALSGLLQVMTRVAADRLDRIEASGTNRAELLPGSAVVRLGLRLRRPAYAVLAARMAGVPPARVEAYARFGRSLGVAQALRTELRDALSPNWTSHRSEPLTGAPMALFLAQADRRDRDEMQRLLVDAENTQAARAAIRHRLHRVGVVAQIEASIGQHCALARREAASLQPPPTVTGLVSSEIDRLSAPDTACRSRHASPLATEEGSATSLATGIVDTPSDGPHPARTD